MEQNSFLFQQASRIGLTHSDVLRHIVERACARNGVPFPKSVPGKNKRRKKVNILMGGDNSEKQVSLMSGTNVWLKLRRSEQYQPQPYLLDPKGGVWQLPYHLCLNHTVEEIAENCEKYQEAKVKLGEFERRARLHLGLLAEKDEEEFFEPRKLTLKKLLDTSKFVFIALHGGDGENGTLQKMLASKKVKFNGPDEEVSRLCSDKWDTARFIDRLGVQGVSAIPGKIVETKKMCKFSDSDFKTFWQKTKKELGAETLIVKPRADGCTTGIAHLYSSDDLKKYLMMTADKVPFIPKQTFEGQMDIIEMPSTTPPDCCLKNSLEQTHCMSEPIN